MNDTPRVIPVYFFSGTGNTRHAASVLRNRAEARGGRLILEELTNRSEAPGEALPELFGIMFPIYGSGTPGTVLEWARRLPEGDGQRCFLLATAAGADHRLNTGSSDALTRILRRRGYAVPYFRILAMASNWLVSTPGDLIRKLAAVLPAKCDSILDDLDASVVRRTSRMPVFHFFTGLLAAAEDRLGAPLWGRFLRASDACTGCGKCERDCAAGNITVGKASDVRFGWSCQWCMRCIYECPVDAISPGFMKSVVLEGGYSLKAALDQMNTGEDLNGYLDERPALQAYLKDPLT